MTYTPQSKEEQDFLDKYDASEFPAVSVTGDAAVFTIRNGLLSLLLVKRGGYPYKDAWALPGGFVGPHESADEAMVRELQEETGVVTSIVHLEQLKTYTAPDRDPRMRVISVAFFAIIPNLGDATPGDDAADARWVPVEDLALSKKDTEGIPLAFDHAKIVTDAVERVRSKFEYTTLAMNFLPAEFTLPDLRRVYETVWGHTLHAANFRRKALSTPGFVIPTGDAGPSSSGGRNAQLYRAGDASLLHPALLRTITDQR